ncbi:MAG: hypothetical protein PHT33_12540, partial [bacterium]|nr:hypothetical protein [bacterium]
MSPEQLQQLTSISRETGQPLSELLVQYGYCPEDDAYRFMAGLAGLPFVDIHDGDLDPKIIALIPAELAYRHQVLPLSLNGSVVRIAVADPFNTAAAEDIRIAAGLSTTPVFADPQDIRRLVEEHYVRRMIADTTDEDVQILEDSDDEIGDLERMARETTVIKLVNLILRQAVQERASDVHVEPFERGMRVRYRIDGILHEVSSPP